MVQAQNKHHSALYITLKNIQLRTKLFGLVVFSFAFFGFVGSANGAAEAASLSVSPSGGEYVIGSTFTVSVILNTDGQFVNAVDAQLSFSADKLQVVSPSTGTSIIGIWTNQPSFDNRSGSLSFQGGIPDPGINTSRGIISTITFRVKAPGTASLKFLDGSKVLLNDGRGTDVLYNISSGIYRLTLPPPEGPIVSSPTHPDQSTWYVHPTAVLNWTSGTGIEGYSYILNNDPVTTPDKISEGIQQSVAYKNIGSAINYFHIRALANGAWGGTTHFAFLIDYDPPADFPINISPGTKTTNKVPIIDFRTTDVLSGFDHYEIKIVGLNPNNRDYGSYNGTQPLFIEVVPPYVPELPLGKYDIIVRAYDKAGNYREVTQRLQIVTPFLRIIGSDGLRVGDAFTIPWLYIWLLGFGILIPMLILLFILWQWHKRLEEAERRTVLPGHIREKLDRLKELEKHYGKGGRRDTHRFAAFLVMFAFSLSLLWGVTGSDVAAQIQRGTSQLGLAPPIVTTISKNISNDELFYIGGKTEAADSKVIIYFQSLHTGETFSYSTPSDKIGDWFYSHKQFLPSGSYVLWTQVELGEQLSPPSPQVQMTVRATALQIGSSRISYEVLYFGIALVLLGAVGLLLGIVVFSFRHGRRRHKALLKEVKEAESAVRKGFGELRREIEAQYEEIRKSKSSRELSKRERDHETNILKDLEEIKRHIGEEIWDIEKKLG